MAKYKITLLEPHRVKSTWIRGGEHQIMGSVRQNTPLHSQPILAGALQAELGDNFEIQIVDCRVGSSEELFSTKPYGRGRIEHERVGTSLDSPELTQVAKESNVVGITVNFTQTAGTAAALAKKLKARNKELKVVFGGSDAQARPGFYIDKAGADVVVLGDGEEVAGPIMRSLVGAGKLEDIPSIVHKGGATKLQMARAPINRIRNPAFELVRGGISHWTESHEGPLPEGLSGPLAYVETSRGCHERCNFCASAGVNYRFMGLQQLADYTKFLRSWNINTIMMVADNELTPYLMRKIKGSPYSGREFLIKKYQAFAEAGFHWEFGNGLQYSLFVKDGNIDEELMGAVFQNCFRLYVPLEDPVGLQYPKLHGAPKERRLHSLSTDEIFQIYHVEVLKKIVELGVTELNLGLILGWPGDSIERMQAVTERCQILKQEIKNSHPEAKLFFLPFIGMPIPGTPSYRDLSSKGLIAEDIETHPEVWQLATTAYGNFDVLEARMRMIAELNGEQALKHWSKTGTYPGGV